LFDCDIYLSGNDAAFAAQMIAAMKFRPYVGDALIRCEREDISWIGTR
jgi:hypothetical protein